MADSTIISASLSDKDIKESIDKLVKHVDEGMNKMVASTNSAVAKMKESIKSLGDLKVDFGGSADGGSSKITKKQQELTQEVKNTNAVLKQSEITYDHIAQGIQAATKAQSDGARKYTEEILKQAKAIRESASWKETGHYLSSTGDVFYDKERASSTKREKEHMLSLEDQLVQAEQRRMDVERQASLELQTQTQAQNQLTQAAKGTQQIYESIQAMQVRSNKDVRAGGVKNTSFQNYEDFRMALAAVLGLQKEEIVLADSERASYEKLNTTLKQLRDTYYKLNASERDSENGKALVSSMLEVERSIQKIQRAAARPVSLESIIGINGKGGLSENTLDDIAYKMQKLQLYRSGLDTNAQKSEINQVNAELKRLQKTQREVMGENESLLKSNNALARSFNYMKNRLAFYFTVGASTAFVKKLIEIRSQYELTERALGILVNSASRGSRIFNELSHMSLMSPYTLIELSNAAKQLTAFDIAAKDVVDTTRRLADMAAAVGAPIERLTYALGQIKAYGYLNSRDARMFANAGIPLVKELSNYYSELEGRMVSVADVYDKMKKKAIDYSDVMNVVNKLTDEGGKFYDFQAKMADTLKVKLANLNLAYNNMLNDMGKSSNGTIQTFIKGATLMMKYWREISRVLGTVVTTLGVYKTIQHLALIQGAQGVRNFASLLVNIAAKIRIATTSLAGFRAVMSSIPFIGWATAITALVSYFMLFNRSSDETAAKLKEISDAMEGVRKEASKLLSEAMKTDNFGIQINKLKEMVELAETELHIEIPVDIKDVDEKNVIAKLKNAKAEIDKYLNFSQTFSEQAVGTEYNKMFDEFGKAARTLYTSVTESVDTVIEALSKLQEEGKASAEEVSALYELMQGKLSGESEVEYLQRIVNLYERLGLTSERRKDNGDWHTDTISEDFAKMRDEINRLGISSGLVFNHMYTDAQAFFIYSKSAARQFEEVVDNLAERINLKDIPVDERTLKLEVAIEQEAARNNWNNFAVQYAKQIANEKFFTYISLSDDSKKNTEEELQEWQKQMQQWAKNNGITFTVSFQADDTPKGFAERMGKQWKDAKEDFEVLTRKKKYGLATETEVETAKHLAKEYEKLAAAAGYDTSDKTTQRRAAESELQKALKEEIQLLDKARSVYKQLTKEGVDSNRALAVATEGYEETITHINSVLQKYGIQKFNLAAYAGVQSPHAIMELLQGQLNTLLKSGVAKPEEIKDLQVKLKDVKVDELTFNQKTLTDSLNNELGKLKEEYELGVEFDANPELGSIFADMMGMGREEMNKLPRTYAQLAKKMQESIDNVFADNDVIGKFDLEKMLNKADFDKWVEERGNKLDDSFITALNKIREEMNKVRQKEAEDTVKNWSNLISKYGTIQDKLVSISKDTAKEELDVIKQFGSDEEIASAIDLAEKINVSRTPQEVTRLQKELTELLKKVAEGKNTAISVKAAIEKSEGKNKAKAIWDDFKDSDEYIKMFDNLEYLSIGALDNIMNKLEDVKDKVREDPASMKAAFDSIEKVREAIMNLDPARGMAEGFNSFIQGVRELSATNSAIKATAKYIDLLKNKLNEAKNEEIEALRELDDATQGGDKTKEAEAQDKLNKAKKKQKDTEEEIKNQQEKQNQQQQKQQDAVGKLRRGLGFLAEAAQKWGSKLQTVSDAISAVGNVFAAIGDEETAESINDLNKGFQIMIGVLSAVAAACIAVEAGLSAIYLVAMAIAGVFMGLAFLFEGAANRAITRQINESEATVRKLELAYKDLEAAIEDAYGAAEYGLKQAEISNKKLQLAELKRQLELEKSRSGKHYDQEKVDEYLEKVKDLENEIANMVEDITNDMLGIQSVGNAAEELVSSMIDAFRKGEDYMASYQDTFDKMIENMIVKAIASRVIGDRLQEIWDTLDATMSERSKPQREEIKKIQENIADYEKKIDEAAQDKLNAERLYLYPGLADDRLKEAVEKYDKYTKLLDEENKNLQEAIEAASNAGQITPQDVNSIADMATSFKGEAMESFKALMDAFGIKFGDLAGEQELSNLQQGIQGITETTAGAIEAYLNGVSQQVYLHSELLTQIRDIVVGFNMDAQLATQAEILMQLQASYQVQMSIQSILQGWSSANGMAVRVEMV